MKLWLQQCSLAGWLTVYNGDQFGSMYDTHLTGQCSAMKQKKTFSENGTYLPCGWHKWHTLLSLALVVAKCQYICLPWAWSVMQRNQTNIRISLSKTTVPHLARLMQFCYHWFFVLARVRVQIVTVVLSAMSINFIPTPVPPSLV